ncbi:hypothetical protein OAF56_03035 [Pirellulaceae bacterium]|jgi:hypothetical protein|nr:hypothetical protein [Pirellulaceae bacterium]MDB4640586.1 hypothetical protein [Pirellulaceae bacterium]
MLGTVLILLSGVLFFLMCGLPWIYVWGMNKWLVGMVLYVLVQVAWWIGAAMVGPSAFRRIWTFFMPVRKSKEQL